MEQIKKHSRQRDAILACLRATDTHPSAEWIYRHVKSELPNLSLGTVYRNLSYFASMGEIRSLGTVDGQERFDGDISPHAHFVCKNCGAVIDWVEEDVSAEAEEAAASLGVKITEVDLRFSGLCADCL